MVPLLVKEASSEGVAGLLEEDAHLLVAWITPVELTSALARLERAGGLDQVGLAQARKRLWALKEAWHEVLPTEEVREAAIRALRIHPLRTLDALQLGAALVASGGRPSRLPFVSLDGRLREAAEREGFPLLP